MDSDWAGCSTTRKSTTGIVIRLLGCTLHCISKTQQILALSFGEAELDAIGSGIAEGLALGNFLVEACLCISCKLLVFTDSTAGKTIATRSGASKKTRHIDLKFLHMQENIIIISEVCLLPSTGNTSPSFMLRRFSSPIKGYLFHSFFMSYPYIE